MLNPGFTPSLWLDLYEARQRELQKGAEIARALKEARADMPGRRSRVLPRAGDLLIAIGVWLKGAPADLPQGPGRGHVPQLAHAFRRRQPAERHSDSSEQALHPAPVIM